MGNADRLIAAGDALAAATYEAYLDAAYAALGTLLYAVHNALTTQLWHLRRDAERVNKLPVDAAVAACGAAVDAFRGPATLKQRQAAVAAASGAVAQIGELLPGGLV